MAESSSPDRTQTVWPANPKIFTVGTLQRLVPRLGRSETTHSFQTTVELCSVLSAVPGTWSSPVDPGCDWQYGGRAPGMSTGLSAELRPSTQGRGTGVHGLWNSLGKGQVKRKRGLQVGGNPVFALKKTTLGECLYHFLFSTSREKDGTPDSICG